MALGDLGEEAVSPVIGVILMVAITVVLAAVVFVLVENTGDKIADAPEVYFRKDASLRSVTIIRAGAGSEWLRDVTLAGSCEATATLNGAPWPPAAGTPLTSGDVIAGCASGDTLRVISLEPNQLLYETTFA